MKALCLLLLVVYSFSGFAQKRVEKSVLDSDISNIRIDANSCFQVVLSTVTSQEIRVEAQMDGEYSPDLELTLVEQGNTLVVNAGFHPEFKKPNDKLSAHKVVSISLDIAIPEYKNVTLYGTNTRVVADGNYKKLGITLSDGSCKLKNITEVVEVKTHSGDIIIYENAAVVTAESKYGKVSDNPIPSGHHQYELNTVTGNIKLHKTE